MWKLLAFALGGILSALTGDRILRYRDSIYFVHEQEQVEPPNCHLTEGIEAGSEDLEISPNGLVFYSTGIRFPGIMSFAPDKHGEIMLQDLNKENSKPVVLRISDGFDMESLNPHGISLYQDKKGPAGAVQGGMDCVCQPEGCVFPHSHSRDSPEVYSLRSGSGALPILCLALRPHLSPSCFHKGSGSSDKLSQEGGHSCVLPQRLAHQVVIRGLTQKASVSSVQPAVLYFHSPHSS